jgi:hypothetical protein
MRGYGAHTLLTAVRGPRTAARTELNKLAEYAPERSSQPRRSVTSGADHSRRARSSECSYSMRLEVPPSNRTVAIFADRS